MKQILVLLTFMLVSYAVKAQYVATVQKGNLEEVVVGVLNYDGKKMESYKTAIRQVSGATFVRACHSQRCWMILVDRNLQPNNTTLFTAIQNVESGIDVLYKQANFNDIEKMCQYEFAKP